MSSKTSGASADPPEVGTTSSPRGLFVAAWGAILFFGCRLVDIFLDAQPTASSVGQAVLVEWGASRLGVVWSADPDTTRVAVARRALLGAAVGLVAALALFVVLVGSRGAITERATNVEASVLVLGLASAGIAAWRDEMLFHGITLRALDTLPGPTIGRVGKVLACGVTTAGAALGRADASPRTVVASALLGIVLGALWVHDRGAWRPWAANTCFRFATQTVLSGGLVHTRLAEGLWAGGDAGWLGGTAATIALAPLAVTALGWAARSDRSAS